MLIFGLNRQIAILHVVQVRTNLHNTVRKRECRSNACITDYTISRSCVGLRAEEPVQKLNL